MKSRILFLLVAIFLFATGMRAATPYAVYCAGDMSFHFLTSDTELTKGATLPSNNQTITSVYTVNLAQGDNDPSWYYKDAKSSISVVFEESFADVQPTSCHSWFYSFSSLTEINGLQYLNTEKVTSMSAMFSGCSKITTIDLSNFDTSNVTDMRSMFSNCKGLTSLELSNFDTSKVTDMSWMFYSCNGLTSLELSNFDTHNVADMSYMFSGSVNLTDIDLSSLDTSNVTDMNSMFLNCSNLTTVDLRKFDTSNVVNMGSMFSNSGLISLDLSNFNTSNVTDMSSMFASCTKLTSLDVTRFDTSKVTNMASMFDSCKGLPSLDVTNYDTSIVTDMSSMFSACNGLTSIDLSNFDTSKVTNMSKMFSSCTKLTSLDVRNFDTSSLTNMEYMFAQCSSLTTLDLSNFDTSNVTYMNYTFYYCNGLTTLDLSSFNTKNLRSMQGTFQNCSSLTTLDLSGFNTPNLTHMGSTFQNCSGLTTLDLSSFNTANVTNMSSTFSGCRGLTTLDLSRFDTANVTNMKQMFANCTNLATIYVSDNFTTDKVTTSTGMFSGCTKLRNFDPNYVDVTKANYGDDGYLTYVEIVIPGKPYAIYCRGDESFHFIFSETEYEVDDILPSNNQKITQVYEVNLDPGDTYPAWHADTYAWHSSTIVFEESFKSVKTKSCFQWFSGFLSLTEIKGWENFNTDAVTNMSYMFSACGMTTCVSSLDLSKLDTSNVTNMRCMFSGSPVSSIDISNFNTSKVTDFHNMFASCDRLRMVDLSNATIPDFSHIEESLPSDALTFVPAGTEVTAGKANIVVGDQCESLVLNNAEYHRQRMLKVPYAFTAQNVFINRQFNENLPYTLYLPFEMKVAEFGSFYTGGVYDATAGEVRFSEISEDHTSPNVPYIFIPKQYYNSGITIDGPVAVSMTPEDTEVDGFNGVYSMRVFDANDAAKKVYYGWNLGWFCYAEDGATVDACRAYYKLPASAAASAPAYLKATFGGEGTTGIDSIDSDSDNASRYDINGRPAGPSHNGIVIEKGRKTLNIAR